MNDENVPAPRSEMMIRIVSPSYFRRYIVEERRPLSVAAGVIIDEPETDPRGVIIAVVVLGVMLAVFSFAVTYGLSSLLSVV